MRLRLGISSSPWWEAIVIGRNGDIFTLRFRDYPKLPKFVRHRTAIALMSSQTE
jgi:hypothetical protein